MSPHLAAIALAPPAAAASLPGPQQLAQLGTVLCLYRQQAGGELAGWSQSVRAEAGVEIDSDGMCESLQFYDRADRCCWRLYLLPDSDFLAWERLSGRLPLHADPMASIGIGERLLRRLSGGSGHWAGSILRLHALGGPGSGFAPAAVLAASLARASGLGTAEAIRIVRSQGADDSGLVDGCCCERAARAVCAAGDADAYAPIRFNRHLTKGTQA